MQRIRLLSIAFMLVSSCVLPAIADDYENCTKSNLGASSLLETANIRLRNCNRAISSGQYSNDVIKLAMLFNSRGISYLNLGQIDRAINNFDEALHHNKFVYAYHNRGNAYRCKGDYNHAIGDFDEALRLAPGTRATIELRDLAKAKDSRTECPKSK